MNDSPLEIAAGTYRCPTCGAINQTSANPSDVLKCWLCSQAFKRDGTNVVDPTISGPRNPLDQQGATFGLTTIMIAVTLIAIGFGIFRIAPGLGFLFVVLLTPAFVRAQVIAMRHKNTGVPQTWQQHVGTFMTSLVGTLGVLILISIAAIVALFGTCIFLMTQF